MLVLFWLCCDLVRRHHLDGEKPQQLPLRAVRSAELPQRVVQIQGVEHPFAAVGRVLACPLELEEQAQDSAKDISRYRFALEVVFVTYGLDSFRDKAADKIAALSGRELSITINARQTAQSGEAHEPHGMCASSDELSQLVREQFYFF
jgi:hypothetical protein